MKKAGSNVSVSKVVPLTRVEPPFAGATRLGVIAAWSADEGLLVDYPGNPRGVLPARTTVSLTAAQLEECIASRRAVRIAFDGPEGEAIVVGVVQDLPRSIVGGQAADAPGGAGALRAFVDGQELVFQAAERIEFRCGDARLVLTKDGKVLTEGAYVSTHSSGALRLAGASVELN